VTLHELSPSTTYYVRVLAVGCDGTRSKPSQWIGLHTGPPTVDHGALAAVAANVSSAARSSVSRREERDGGPSEVDDEEQTVNDEQGR